jgi:predicted adenylyl cyclase CyaB
MKIELIEIKARLPSLGPARRKILSMGASTDGTFTQVDTYYNSTAGRLKLREVDGEPTSKLIHYDREDTPDPKRSDVTIHETEEPRSLKTILERALGVKVTVTKTREIYRHQGTQIHLDKVEDLGTFIEFERPITDLPRDREILQKLMQKLNIKAEDLITGSYSDLKLDTPAEV